LWIDEAPYMRNVVLDVVIVLAGALLVVAGALSSPQLPPRMSARDIRTTLIALAAIALTAVALTVVNANWSPAQRMPSSFAAEQIPAPAGADLALSLTALGPDGPETVRRADFSAYDIAGRPVPVDIRLVLTDGMGERATLLVELPRSSQAQLCGPKQLQLARTAGAPIKLIMRDNASDMTLQAVIPIGWCTG
jgi:hypothetical protein